MKKMRGYLRWAVVVVVGMVLLYFVSALVMIALPMPEVAKEDALSKEEQIANGVTVEQFCKFEPRNFTMRDGEVLNGARYVSTSPHSMLFLHGASGHSSQLNKGIGLVRESVDVEVFTYDHRGHGDSPGTRGDLAYVDQYVADLADVLTALRERKPDGRMILAGHSMGGGIIQRYAMSDEPQLADAYLLFAPLPGRGMPNERMPRFAQPHYPRFLGIRMLNVVGIERFNHLPVLKFGLPEFDGHINQYTFTAALSMRPDSAQEGLAALQKPLLVILGENDGTMVVTMDAAAAAVRKYSGGEVVVIKDEGHHVHNNPDAVAEVATWMSEMFEDERGHP